jgi:hypothetical protein
MYKLPKLILGCCAIVGILLGYLVINTFVISITVIQFIVVEIVISVLHATYNRIKVKII